LSVERIRPASVRTAVVRELVCELLRQPLDDHAAEYEARRLRPLLRRSHA